ncbi:MAG: sugar-binding protein [Moorea sp. SIOASIH]|uniref:SpvB/TcaC N-terminal domain-containing protein n=1 Tax=Moorena sp. SIOASIH TaxID=2607817 RepID=UPI0013B8BACB|nr:SpvB/TcaC N-terminal domain-containing protein [Moorena sp. SIOASIH]NEO34972.1 sugar-binding protein [Moorena sp. SIOASIH]
MENSKITTTQLSLPKGGGAIQGIGETFQANEFTGTAALSIPIPTTPCRGFEPQLSVEYSSGSGNGTFGLGFALSVPNISRKTSKGLPKYDGTDTFILSNADDLVPVGNRTKGSFDITRYCPRTEGLFAKIEHWCDPTTGSSFWQVISKDNITSRYGKTAQARISDPDNENHVFAWLLEESFDAKGNCIVYKYKPENTEGFTQEIYEVNRTQTANKYLEKIQYGNYQPLQPQPGDNLSSVEWHFEVVFDYGEYQIDPSNKTKPYTYSIGEWKSRKDPFSTYHAGFEIRTHRLCRNVLMFHNFTELHSEPVLVHATHFDYQESSNLTLLKAVESIGYRYENVKYQTKSLPPLEFQYTQFNLEGQEFEPFLEEDSRFLPGLISYEYQILDLYGEGIPGVLYNDGTSTRYWEPAANGEGSKAVRYNPPQTPQSLPIAYGKTNNQQLIDLTGNGQLDLVVSSPNVSGYYEVKSDRTWQSFQTFPAFPNEYLDPDSQLTDITGDGLLDLLRLEGDRVKVYPGKGKAGFDVHIIQQPEPDLPLEKKGDHTEALRFADIFGTGRQHLVRISNGAVECWPSLGYGKFGKKVTLGNAPSFGIDFDISRLFLADIDGSGTADILYVKSDRIDIYYNQGGNRFSKPFSLLLPQPYDNLVQLQFADVLGNGTTCLVLSSRNPDLSLRHQYYDFCAGQKPHLLISYANNLGTTTRFHYQASTQFYLDDKKAGKPWKTRLHFPVHLLAKTETIDQISGAKFVSRYAYHEGYFDPVEREFRGFGLVERWDSETYDHFNLGDLHGEMPFVQSAPELHVPPVYVKTWYHVGASRPGEALSRYYGEDYYGGDSEAHDLPDSSLENPGLEPETDALREASRALHGQVLRQEVYALDGDQNPDLAPHPYTVTENNYRVRIIQPRSHHKYPVCLVSPRESLSYDYERNPVDPRISHAFTLEVDAYGYPTKTCQIFYPRRSTAGSALSEQVTLRAIASTTQFIHTVDDFYLLGIPAEEKALEIGGLTVGASSYFSFEQVLAQVNQALANEIPFGQSLGGATLQARLLSWNRYYYWNQDKTDFLKPRGTSALALSHHVETAEFTAAQITEVLGGKTQTLNTLLADGGYQQAEGYWWNPGSIQFYLDGESYYLLHQVEDAFGVATTLQYDRYLLLPQTVTDALGNVTQTEIDYQVLAPWKVTDTNDNVSEVLFDPLGLVIATTIYGTENGTVQGDSPLKDYQLVADASFDAILAQPDAYLQSATTYFFYDVDARQEDSQPPRSIQLMRETHVADLEDGDTTSIRIQVAYSDGLGRALQTKFQSSPEPAFTLVDKELTEVDAPERWLVSGRRVYNNKGLPIKQYEPFYSTTADYEPEAVVTEHGVTSVIHYDPLARPIRVDTPKGFFSKVEFTPWHSLHYDANDTLKASPYYLENNNNGLPDDEQDALTKTEVHDQTPTELVLDNQGRTFLTREMLTADAGRGEKLETYVALDISGNQLASADPRLYPQGLDNFRQTYTMAGEVIYAWSADAGERWNLSNVLGQPIHHWNQRGFHFTTTYDQLQRPVEVRVQGDDGAGLSLDQVVERLDYGETEANPTIKNLRGQVVRHYDSAGVVHFDLYDIKGALRRVRREIRREYKAEVDWQTLDSVELESKDFSSETTYNALGQTITTTHPDQSRETLVYHPEGWLQQLYVTLSDGSQEQPLITDLAYNARGQRTQINYGNSVVTTYQYEPETFRLTHLETVAPDGSTWLQRIDYAYDPVGNITRLRDQSHQQILSNQSDVEALSDYTYDPLYRLTVATGRQHPELTGEEYKDPTAFKQSRFLRLDNSPVLEPYTQKYTYDIGGNLTQIQHDTTGSHSWTREMQTAATSNRAVLKTLATAPDQVDDFYDGHGNLLRSQQLQQLRWNCQDHLAAVEVGADRAITNSEYYLYDGAGQRVRKVTETPDGEVRDTLYLGALELQQNAQGQVVARNLRFRSDGHAAITLCYQDAKNTTLRYQLSNHLGSVALELDHQGETLSYEEYLPYGGTALIAGSNEGEVEAKTYRYSTKERDDTSSLYYYGARYYAPWFGRWLNPDPSGAAGGLNIYSMVQNNPITLIDPDGRTGVNNQLLLSSTRIADIAMLGAHDAGTYNIRNMESISRCQHLSLTEQAEVGVQYFDLRVRTNRAGEWKFYHGEEKLQGLIKGFNAPGSAIEPLADLFTYAKNHPERLFLFKFHFDQGKDSPVDISFFLADTVKQLKNNLISGAQTKRLGEVTIGESVHAGKNIGILGHHASFSIRNTPSAKDYIFEYGKNTYGGWGKTPKPKQLVKHLIKGINKENPEGRILVSQTNLPALIPPSLKVLGTPKAWLGLKSLASTSHQQVAEGLEEASMNSRRNPGVISMDFVGTKYASTDRYKKLRNKSNAPLYLYNKKNH